MLQQKRERDRLHDRTGFVGVFGRGDVEGGVVSSADVVRVIPVGGGDREDFSRLRFHDAGDDLFGVVLFFCVVEQGFECFLKPYGDIQVDRHAVDGGSYETVRIQNDRVADVAFALDEAVLDGSKFLFVILLEALDTHGTGESILFLLFHVAQHRCQDIVVGENA